MTIMDNTQFSNIRKRLGKTQKQLSQLLGTSLKAVQRFEQGWRKVPVHVERQLYFLLSQQSAKKDGNLEACWEIMACDQDVRDRCPAWELNSGTMCWFINGTLCKGEPQKDWHEKMIACQKCKVFKDKIPDV